MSENATRAMTVADRGGPCFVRHPDAGGQCWKPATMQVYGLDFCEVHGEEVRIGALTEENNDAVMFFQRFRNPHVPDQSSAVERSFELVIDRLYSETPLGKDHSEALRRAYPTSVVPEAVRERTIAWRESEEQGYLSVADALMNSLSTLHKCMRIAFTEGETWLVEILEQERQSVAAQIASIVKDLEIRQPG